MVKYDIEYYARPQKKEREKKGIDDGTERREKYQGLVC